MLIQEFENLTGYKPTDNEYRIIEQEYYDFDGDKKAFCSEWKKNGLERLAKKLSERITSVEAEKRELLEKAENEYSALKNKLDKTLKELDRVADWKPYDNIGTKMPQKEYEELANSGCIKELSDSEAKDILYNFFGFAPESVTIVNEVNTYEYSERLCRARTKEKYVRKPVYNATDWYYIRFNAGSMTWEAINDRLEPYEH